MNAADRSVVWIGVIILGLAAMGMLIIGFGQ